ncbi:MAG: glycerol kinase [Betaproteobacteria bacterium]|nr:glycerol kinase [Betaproteobacteria bacterium]
MSTRYLLALDQGTASSRAIVFDSEARMCALAQREFAQHFPRPGWVEHDAMEIWSTQLAVAREAISKAQLQARDIAAIGIANQRETTVVWDHTTGVPIAPAIVWQDRRTTLVCEQLKQEGLEPLVRAKTGLVLDPYFSATKIAWILDHVAGARARAERGELAFGTIDTWLAYKLSGGAIHATDPSNGARTLLFDIEQNAWDEDLLRHFRVPRAVMPEIVPSSGVLGHTAAAVFGTPIAIAGIAGDQQSALFGQACHQAGMAKNTYGTGCFMLLNTGTKRVHSNAGLLTTRTADPGRHHYALEGSVFVAGAAVQWLRDGLGIIAKSADIEPLAASVPDAGGVRFVPAFTGLGAPYWDARARGTMIGLTRGTTAAHLARAVLDAIALQSAELLEAMQRDAGLTLTELRVDGGATANKLLMQVQADLLGVPVIRPATLETTALGTAYLAGFAVGVWNGLDQISSQWRKADEIVPMMTPDQRGQMLDDWRRAVARSRDWATD